MSETSTQIKAKAHKPGSKGLLIALFLVIFGSVGGYFSVHFGLLPIDSKRIGQAADENPKPPKNTVAQPHEGEVSFVEMEPLLISLTGEHSGRHLRFHAQIEVDPENAKTVEQMMPRVVDTLNSYLRALAPQTLEEPMALTRLRAQMLHRIGIVLGDGLARDLLIMEFVLN